MSAIFACLSEQFNDHIQFREKRPGIWQLIAPLYHEDGDMLEIFLKSLDSDGRQVRISDYGMTLMRLSYSYEINTENRERILGRILSENNISEENGSLYIDSQNESLYPSILHFAQTIAKISNMQQFRREVIESLFYEQLAEFIEQNLQRFNPRRSLLPVEDRDDLEVDYAFNGSPRPNFLFGVKDTLKARLAAISCLEFQKRRIPFRSVIVHQDFESLPRKDRVRITSAADKQFPSLDDFKSKATEWFEREAYMQSSN